MTKPEFWLKAVDKRTSGKTFTSKVGMAWVNPDGSISIDLNAFVVLETVTRQPTDLVLTLYPITKCKQ